MHPKVVCQNIVVPDDSRVNISLKGITLTGIWFCTIPNPISVTSIQTYVTAAGIYAVRPKVSRDSSCPESRYVHSGSANPSTDVNRIFLVRVGQTYHTDKVGDLVPQYFLSSQLGITVHAIETRVSPWYGSEVIPVILTKK